MVQFSHVFVCRTAVSLGLAVSALYWLSSGLYEVSWSCWGIDGILCQAKAIAGLDVSSGTSLVCAILTLWWTGERDQHGRNPAFFCQQWGYACISPNKVVRAHSRRREWQQANLHPWMHSGGAIGTKEPVPGLPGRAQGSCYGSLGWLMSALGDHGWLWGIGELWKGSYKSPPSKEEKQCL